jgi:hypothetical protein
MKRFLTAASIGLLFCSSAPVWAGGDADETFKDTLRALQERIKQLEDEVRQLKSAPPPAPAPTATAAPEGIDDRLKKLEDGLGLLKGIKIGGMVYGSYNYNFNNPDSKDNSLRIFDTRANNFTFDLAQISLSGLNCCLITGERQNSSPRTGPETGRFQTERIILRWKKPTSHIPPVLARV